MLCIRIKGMRKLEFRYIMVALYLAAAVATQAQGTAVKSFTYGATVGTLDRYCSACHSWSSTYEDLIGAGVIIPGKPDTSPAMDYIESGRMPPSGPVPSAPEKQLLYNWILAGAPKPAADGLSGASGTTAAPALPKAVDAVSSATGDDAYEDDDEEDDD